ncbi:hypothetical protein [Polyangium aurulentum]|uniref:hypothetical protein n=1 Tax=Polyangium aurulentum TaxID=2567896 RepID=UPI0010ADB5EA|nr:hypothetical protein [Polyangium aurulentum]UQA54794.1 hypothetical protein E8A73_025845 [Polyangium aurulentum]
MSAHDGNASKWPGRASAAVAMVAALLIAPSCRRAPEDAAELGLALIDEARGEGISAELLDGARIERLRKVLLLKRVEPTQVSARTLEELWWNDGEASFSADERLRLRQVRATQSVRRAVSGDCRAEIDEGVKGARLARITAAVPYAPAEANAEIERLAAELAPVQGARVTCERGTFGLLAMPGDRMRVIDIFAIEEEGHVVPAASRAPASIPAP